MRADYYSLSFIFLASFTADRISPAIAVPAPQVFAPVVGPVGITAQPGDVPQPTAAVVEVVQPQYTLLPLSEIFYAITRDPSDPPAAFETISSGDQQAVIPDDPLYPLSTGAKLADTIVPLTTAPTVTATSTGEQPSTTHLVSSAIRRVSSTDNHATPAPVSTIIAAPIPDVSEDENHDGPVIGQKKLSMFSSIAVVFGALAALSLLVFLLLDPRVSGGCRRQRVNSRGLGKRPISSWFPFPSSTASQASVASRVSRKAVSNSDCRNFDPLETSERSGGSLSTYPWPRSKFSVSSSEYSQISAATTTDTMLAENTRANAGTVSNPPVRPPRPPTADSPGIIPYSVYLASENRLYLDPLVTDEAPLLSPNKFFTMPSPSMSSTSTLRPGVGTNSEFYSQVAGRDGPAKGRHLRTSSAPGFIGSPVEEECPLYMDPVARRVLKHRRSRSASGWAYAKREGGSNSDSDNSTYHGVFGQAL